MQSSKVTPQLILPFAILFGLVAAYFLGAFVAQEQYRTLVGIVIGFCGLAWAVCGRSIWWLPVFFLPSLGGLFFAGFKIYVHEMAVLIALIPLILLIALNRSSARIRSHKVQRLVFLVALYLGIHLLGCLVYLKVSGLPGTGNVVRRYADAMWAFGFLLPFLYFGNTKYLRWAMHLMFAATLARFFLGMYAVYFRGGTEAAPIFVPFINYVPAGINAAEDLRISGYALVALAIVYFCIHRNLLMRVPLLLLMGAGLWGTFLGGSRVMLFTTFLMISCALLLYRRLFLVFACMSAFAIGIMAINLDPTSLELLPDTAKRAASIFVFDREQGTYQGGTELSNTFHSRLISEGWKSWTENAFTILFGRGTRAFDDRSTQAEGIMDFEYRVQMAVDTSRFEKGLWDTLCTFGLVGFVLFFWCLGTVIKYCLSALMKQKISSYALGLAFLGTFQCISWILLCWIGGNFPSHAIMLGIVAIIALEEEAAASRKKEPVSEPLSSGDKDAPSPPGMAGRFLPHR